MRFEWGSKETKNLYYGFRNKEENRNEFSTQIHQKFKNIYGNKTMSNTVWLCFTYWEDYKDWNSDTYLKIYEGEMKSIIESKDNTLWIGTDEAVCYLKNNEFSVYNNGELK